MILYGLKNCDTCRKALKQIGNAGITVHFADVRDDGVPPNDLRRAEAEFGSDLLNTRSTTWRGLSEEARAGRLLDLIREYPTLMKRPLIDANGALHLGWSKETQAALLGGV